MYKQIIALLVLSLLIVIGATYFAIILQWILDIHQGVIHVLSRMFSTSSAGEIATQFVAFILMPLVVAAVIAIVYKLLRKKMVPYFMHIIWVLWIIQVTGVLLRH
jgi:hypothetical protein